MSSYFIQAADVLFFKDGREIAAGEEYSASTIFPPNPSSIYGALRSAIIANSPNPNLSLDNFGLESNIIRDLVGSKQFFGDLRIEDFSLAQYKNDKVERIFRLPNDVLKRKKPDRSNGEKDVTLSLSIKKLKNAGIETNLSAQELDLPWIQFHEGAFFEAEPLFLTEKQFQAYLLGDLGKETDENSVNYQLINAAGNTKQTVEKFFKKEPRMGITINNETRLVKDGNLFTTPFVRFNPKENVGLFVQLNQSTTKEIVEILKNSLLRLGGDGKLAQLIEVKKETDSYKTNFMNKAKAVLTQKRLYKLVLTTPAIFEKNGWFPDQIDNQSMSGIINEIQLKLISASIGKFTTVGGWDLAKRAPKPTVRAVPAGSVYYFTSEAEPEKVYDALHQKSICINQNNKKQAFGISYIGVQI